MLSNSSNEKPSGSMLRWHCAQSASRAWTSKRSRVVLVGSGTGGTICTFRFVGSSISKQVTRRMTATPRSTHAVDRGKRRIDHGPVGAQEVGDGSRRGFQYFAYEISRLLTHRVAHAGKVRIDRGVLGRSRDAVDAEPLADQLDRVGLPGLGGKQSSDLGFAAVLRVERAGNGRIEQRVVGRAPGDRVAELGCDLVRGQGDDILVHRAVADLRQVQETR